MSADWRWTSMIVKTFIFLIWTGIAQPMTADAGLSNTFVSKQSWNTQTECEVAVSRTMQFISGAMKSRGTETPVMLGQCIEYTPGQDVWTLATGSGDPIHLAAGLTGLFPVVITTSASTSTSHSGFTNPTNLYDCIYRFGYSAILCPHFRNSFPVVDIC